MGVRILRGGAFKPRTSPRSFQGLGEKALVWLAQAREKYGLHVVSEVMDPADIPLMAHYVDVLQIGARNMQNYSLLKKLARQDKPVLLKRGPAATVEEFILAAEYILSGGRAGVILCERGIRTFERYTRNTLDLSCVALVKQFTYLPIIVDLSHSLGRKDIMAPLARAALACGADGLMMEVHPEPAKALCDGQQSLDFAQFQALLAETGCFGFHGRKRGRVIPLWSSRVNAWNEAGGLRKTENGTAGTKGGE
ncbi:3-deoxy-7-phosphoheptulonate synthase [Desulfotomaculum copahuensis]|uniref:3-deoxy-7-phosphoheptulonate synthase n=2 Tax=Desulfotomaculum copahuensis TaxID=1838280 RepID=A0A1B7LFV7_9FIRM|nr:3-deoxy-7-phosphoheptulonate synthase [Desulfotomaculum copahuensis]